MKLKVGGQIVDASGTPAQLLAIVEGRDQPLPVLGGWGTSYDEAVVISVQGLQDQGVPVRHFISVERAFLAAYRRFEESRRQGAGEPVTDIFYEVRGQSLEGNEGRTYDRISVAFEDHFEDRPSVQYQRDFYFDITEPFEFDDAGVGPTIKSNGPIDTKGMGSTGDAGTKAPTPMGRKAGILVGAILGFLAVALGGYAFTEQSSVGTSESTEGNGASEAVRDRPRPQWLPAGEADYVRWQQPIALSDSGHCMGAFYHTAGSGVSVLEVEIAYDIRMMGTDFPETRTTKVDIMWGSNPGDYGRINVGLYPYELLSPRQQVSFDTGGGLPSHDELSEQVGFEVVACRPHAFLVIQVQSAE